MKSELVRSGLSFATPNDKNRTIVLKDIQERIKNKVVVLLIEVKKASKKITIRIKGVVKIKNNKITIGGTPYSRNTRVLGVEYIF